jgi:hypothetical protein
VRLLRRLFDRKKPVPHPGPQGEDYEAVKMTRQAQKEQQALAESLIKKGSIPFLDDPYS